MCADFDADTQGAAKSARIPWGPSRIPTSTSTVHAPQAVPAHAHGHTPVEFLVGIREGPRGIRALSFRGPRGSVGDLCTFCGPRGIRVKNSAHGDPRRN